VSEEKETAAPARRGGGGARPALASKSGGLKLGGALLAAAVLVALLMHRDRDVRAWVAGDASIHHRAPPLPTPVLSGQASNALSRGRDAFVGSASCVPCHREQSKAYVGSHHEKALVVPSPSVVEARFDGSHFTSKHEGTTTFGLSDGKPVVKTLGSTGRLETFPVAYISGVWPLEQYVVRTERGKLQSLGVVWDSRVAAEGGNRWLHVYGKDGIAPTDPFHFTKAAQNWNHVCADCHSTFVERRYEPEADRFDTRWAELSVGCEACHGPGAEHVRTARAGGPIAPFAARLKFSEPWLPSATGSPAPRLQDGVEVEVCAPCHSRREPLKEGFVAGEPLLDSFEPELLRPGSYHADGQVEGEVYEWASFLQSRMYHSGVRCSDCHNAHSGKLHAPGNLLCGRCHEPARFDAETHSHHAGAKAPLCIDCHMPPATFMQIDERRDHSIRVPRPDHSVAFGTPNACNGCHTERPATWARDRVTEWFPSSRRRSHFVEALTAERRGALDAPRLLRSLVEDPSVPAIARATALESLRRYPSDGTLEKLRTSVASPDPLVVYGAVLGASELPSKLRASLLVPLLKNRTRVVRIAVGKALASVPVSELPASSRSALESVFAEVEQSFDVSASRAEIQVERSAFELARGKLAEAEKSLKRALRLEPCLAEAHLNFADLERQRGDESAAGRAIRKALACSPEHAAAHHAFGLWLVRAQKPDSALASLKRAVTLAPEEPRFSYVLAVALVGRNQRDEAIRVLETALRKRPNDADALRTLSALVHEAGQVERSVQLRHRLERLLGR
jgi:Tfp pilus assembly protein PilF